MGAVERDRRLGGGSGTDRFWPNLHTIGHFAGVYVVGVALHLAKFYPVSSRRSLAGLRSAVVVYTAQRLNH